MGKLRLRVEKELQGWHRHPIDESIKWAVVEEMAGHRVVMWVWRDSGFGG